ncbi:MULTISPECIES: hypothetical protein [unclassified Pseudomonas]|uniref:hypothetical protein n=1 Tax=unclassified Pseudomonas TaxID=196821 RepID=UPI0025EBE098|nr:MULTISPECIES: hypothetical protein [unclassified Pseudomonas]
MKTSIVLGFTLSILAASSAFASPRSPAASQTRVPEATHAHAAVTDANIADRAGLKPFAMQPSSTLMVAENRKEFGSSYQRY